MQLHKIETDKDFPAWLDRSSLAEFLYQAISPYNDTKEDTLRGIDYALSQDAGRGGFIIIGEEDRKPVGAVVMLNTGMKGFVPENILLFVAVDPSMRGRGLGRQLCEKAIAETDGDVCLHVEYENPAKRLYERIGFESKYAEMRLSR